MKLLKTDFSYRTQYRKNFTNKKKRIKFNQNPTKFTAQGQKHPTQNGTNRCKMKQSLQLILLQLKLKTQDVEKMCKKTNEKE